MEKINAIVEAMPLSHIYAYCAVAVGICELFVATYFSRKAENMTGEEAKGLSITSKAMFFCSAVFILFGASVLFGLISLDDLITQ